MWLRVPDLRPGGSRRLLRLFVALSAAWVLVIFAMSAFSPAASADQSGWLRDALAWLTGFDLEEAFLRKLAHFAEYALLGFLLGCALAQTVWRRRDVARVLALGFLIAFLDESIQLLSGRGPAIADVWLDGAGFLCGLLAALGLWRLLKGRREDVRQP